MATRLSRTPSSTGNRKTWTFSAWIKRTGSLTGTNTQNILHAGSYSIIRFENENLEYLDYDGSSTALKNTSAKLKDPNAWYHIVIAADFTQASADNRVKFYINGVQETSFGTNNVKAQDYETKFNLSGTSMNLGADSSNGSPFDGVMSHVHWIDGTAYDASAFGETDAITGEWKIKTSPNVSYGSQGFWWLKDNNSTTDNSPNSNTATISGTLTKTEDCPSNVFATWNPLANSNSNYVLSKGNTSYSNADNDWSHGALISTIGIPPSGGKYYWEHKKTYAGNHIIFGLISEDQVHRAYRDSGTDIYERINGVQLSNSSNSGLYLQEATDSGSIGAVANGDILMCAYDADNSKLWYGINGTWHNSGDPANGTNETIGSSEFTAGKIYFAFSQSHNSSGTASSDTNFGNGYFGTTQISSAGTNASGNGIFEYDVPNGFTALSTKGLNL